MTEPIKIGPVSFTSEPVEAGRAFHLSTANFHCTIVRVENGWGLDIFRRKPQSPDKSRWKKAVTAWLKDAITFLLLLLILKTYTHLPVNSWTLWGECVFLWAILNILYGVITTALHQFMDSGGGPG